MIGSFIAQSLYFLLIIFVSPSHGGGHRKNQTVEVSLFNEAWNLGGEGAEGREQREAIISKHYHENKEIIHTRNLHITFKQSAFTETQQYLFAMVPYMTPVRILEAEF